MKQLVVLCILLGAVSTSLATVTRPRDIVDGIASDIDANSQTDVTYVTCDDTIRINNDGTTSTTPTNPSTCIYGARLSVGFNVASSTSSSYFVDSFLDWDSRTSLFVQIETGFNAANDTVAACGTGIDSAVTNLDFSSVSNYDYTLKHASSNIDTLALTCIVFDTTNQYSVSGVYDVDIHVQRTTTYIDVTYTISPQGVDGENVGENPNPEGTIISEWCDSALNSVTDDVFQQLLGADAETSPSALSMDLSGGVETLAVTLTWAEVAANAADIKFDIESVSHPAQTRKLEIVESCKCLCKLKSTISGSENFVFSGTKLHNITWNSGTGTLETSDNGRRSRLALKNNGDEHDMFVMKDVASNHASVGYVVRFAPTSAANDLSGIVSYIQDMHCTSGSEITTVPTRPEIFAYFTTTTSFKQKLLIREFRDLTITNKYSGYAYQQSNSGLNDQQNKYYALPRFEKGTSISCSHANIEKLYVSEADAAFLENRAEAKRWEDSGSNTEYDDITMVNTVYHVDYSSTTVDASADYVVNIEMPSDTGVYTIEHLFSFMNNTETWEPYNLLDIANLTRTMRGYQDLAQASKQISVTPYSRVTGISSDEADKVDHVKITVHDFEPPVHESSVATDMYNKLYFPDMEGGESAFLANHLTHYLDVAASIKRAGHFIAGVGGSSTYKWIPAMVTVWDRNAAQDMDAVHTDVACPSGMTGDCQKYEVVWTWIGQSNIYGNGYINADYFVVKEVNVISNSDDSQSMSLSQGDAEGKSTDVRSEGFDSKIHLFTLDETKLRADFTRDWLMLASSDSIDWGNTDSGDKATSVKGGAIVVLMLTSDEDFLQGANPDSALYPVTVTLDEIEQNGESTGTASAITLLSETDTDPSVYAKSSNYATQIVFNKDNSVSAGEVFDKFNTAPESLFYGTKTPANTVWLTFAIPQCTVDQTRLNEDGYEPNCRFSLSVSVETRKNDDTTAGEDRAMSKDPRVLAELDDIARRELSSHPNGSSSSMQDVRTIWFNVYNILESTETTADTGTTETESSSSSVAVSSHGRNWVIGAIVIVLVAVCAVVVVVAAFRQRHDYKRVENTGGFMHA